MYESSVFPGRPELQDARTWFQRATVLDPSFAPGFHGLALAYLYRGLAYIEKGDAARGNADQKKAVKLDPALGDR